MIATDDFSASGTIVIHLNMIPAPRFFQKTIQFVSKTLLLYIKSIGDNKDRYLVLYNGFVLIWQENRKPVSPETKG
jgi:hypothetical protein